MIVYLLNPKIGFAQSSGIRLFHSLMFHGVSTRVGEDLLTPSPFLGGIERRPLFIQKNVYRLAHIWQPSTHLVVSDRLRETLHNLSSIEWEHVVFTKLFEHPYEEYDFSFFDDYPGMTPEEFIARIPHEPRFEKVLGLYSEMIIARHQDVCDSFGNLEEISLNGIQLVDDEVSSITVSEDLMKEHPFLWHPAGVLVSEKAFDVLSQYLDRTYFQINRVTNG